MSNFFEILEWDSTFFGIKVARLNDSFCAESFDEKISELRAKKVKVAYGFVAPDDTQRNQALVDSGAKIVDQKVKYYIDTHGHKEISNPNIFPFGERKATPALIEIALQTNEYSRFRVDENFGAEACQKLYQQWITNAVEGTFDDQVFVFKQNDEIQGLVTLKLSPEAGRIGLIGVDKKAQGFKIGTSLLNTAISFVKRSRIDRLEVSTQKANKAACAFYQKNGLKLCEQINVYHLWL